MCTKYFLIWSVCCRSYLFTCLLPGKPAWRLCMGMALRRPSGLPGTIQKKGNKGKAKTERNRKTGR